MRNPLHPLTGARRTTRWIAVVVAAGSTLSACSAAKQRDAAVYGPTESVIEVVAVLRRHVPDDTYRFPAASDFTKRNVYRSTLLRLENLEKVHANALRAGHMDAAVAFAKGRSLERLRAYDLAAEHYRAAAGKSPRLRDEAVRSAEINERIHRANEIGIDLPDPLPSTGKRDPFPTDSERVLAELDDRSARLSGLIDLYPESHYVYVVREEIERTDVVRAQYFATMRHALPGGQVRAISELQRVASRHASSKYHRRHLLDVANFYARMAEEYTQANPPESLRFDPVVFQELVEAAMQIYQTVAAEDGWSEKLEAGRRLEAFLAFTLQVDRDRFTK